jgi:hypothetical protein
MPAIWRRLIIAAVPVRCTGGCADAFHTHLLGVEPQIDYSAQFSRLGFSTLLSTEHQIHLAAPSQIVSGSVGRIIRAKSVRFRCLLRQHL